MNNKKTDYILGRIKDEYYLLSSDDVKSGDWMADQNGVYLAPDIDGFIGFSKVVASTEKLKYLPKLIKESILKKMPVSDSNVIIWNVTIPLTQPYKEEGSKPIVSWGYIDILSIEKWSS